MPIWELVVECAKELTQEGVVPFTRLNIIDRIHRIRPGADRKVIDPIIQGLTDNLTGGVPCAGGHVLHSVGRGQFRLIMNDASARQGVALGKTVDIRFAMGGQSNDQPGQSRGAGIPMPMVRKIEIEKLTPMQRKKLRVAAEILKHTAVIYDGTKCLRPLWGAGVITHGQPKIQDCIIGITEEAEKSVGEKLAQDHLFRVTETVEYILSRASNLSVEEIERILLDRSIKMITTRNQNNSVLRNALKKCPNKDDWQELYRVAGIKYRLY